MSAAQVSLGLAWKSGVAAEIIAVPQGTIGEMLYYTSLWLQSVDLFTWTAVLLLLSIAFEKLLVSLLKLGFRRLWNK